MTPSTVTRIVLTCLLAVSVPAALRVACADEEALTDGVLSDSAWFNAERGTVVPVTVQETVDDTPGRDSRWLPKAQRIEQPKQSSAAGTTGGSSGLFGSGLTLTNLLGWLLLISFVAVAVGVLAYTLSWTEFDFDSSSRTNRTGQLDGPDEQTIERMKHLPAELRRTDVNLRSEAMRLMNEGQFDQAIILLFGHQLLLLDRVGMLRLNRGKTNRKYVRETRASDADAASRLQATVSAFESSYFGGHALTEQQFADLWQLNSQLEQMLQQRAEVHA